MWISQRFAIGFVLCAASGWGNQISFSPGAGQLKPPQSKTPADQLCVIGGRVTDAQTGQPVRKVNLRLVQRNGGERGNVQSVSAAEPGYASSSDAEGNFRFEGVEPGEYNFSGNRTGYLHTQYGAKRANGAGTVLSLRPGQQLTNVALAMLPQSVITGKVVDEDGDPLSEVMVQIISRHWMRGKLRLAPQNSTNSNDLGDYRLANLPPGKYYVTAQIVRPDAQGRLAGKVEMRPVRTFYPEALNLGNATPVEVKAGQDVPGINIRMHSSQTYHVRGRVAGLSPDDRTERMTVNLSPRGEESFIPFGPQMSIISKERTFDIAGVAPGSYYLNIYSMGGRFRSLARQEIDIGAGDVNDVNLNVTPGGSLAGHVAVVGSPRGGTTGVNVSSVRVFAIPSDGVFMASNAEVKEDGTITIDNLFPGKYALSFSVPGGAYVKSIRLGQQEIQGREIDLSNGVSGQLEVTLSYGTAELGGSVQLAQTQSSAASNGQAAAAPSSAQVVLVPEALNSDGSGLYTGSLNTSGTFSIKNIAPGRFHAYAFEEVNTQDLQNPDLLKALESRGTEVELGESEQKQIQLTLIRTDEYQQLLTRLGLESQ